MILIIALPSNAFAAIAWDNSTSAVTSDFQNFGTSSYSMNHVVTGTDPILIVWVGFYSLGDVLTGVTYNGMAMTQFNKDGNGSTQETYGYYLVNPATGSHPVTISFSGTEPTGNLLAVSYTGVSQFAPTVFSLKTATTDAIDVTLITPSANDWLVGAVQMGGQIPTVTTGAFRTGSTNVLITWDSNSALMQGGNAINATANMGGSYWTSYGISLEPTGTIPPPPPPTQVTGFGTINMLAKFTTSTTTIGNALFFDDGSNMTLTAGNLFMPLSSMIDTVSNGTLSFGTSQATTMTFGRSGQNLIINSKVGVGTSTPSAMLQVNGDIKVGSIGTASNCASTASPAVCGTAPAGSVALPNGVSTLIVNTTAVTANSQIFINEDSSLGTRLGITCNTGTGRNYVINARIPGTSFTIKSSGNPATNKACLNYLIVN